MVTIDSGIEYFREYRAAVRTANGKSKGFCKIISDIFLSVVTRKTQNKTTHNAVIKMMFAAISSIARKNLILVS